MATRALQKIGKCFKMKNILILLNTGSPSWRYKNLAKTNVTMLQLCASNAPFLGYHQRKMSRSTIDNVWKYFVLFHFNFWNTWVLCSGNGLGMPSQTFRQDELSKKLTTFYTKGVINNSSISDLRTEWSNKVYTCIKQQQHVKKIRKSSFISKENCSVTC